MAPRAHLTFKIDVAGESEDNPLLNSGLAAHGLAPVAQVLLREGTVSASTGDLPPNIGLPVQSADLEECDTRSF